MLLNAFAIWLVIFAIEVVRGVPRTVYRVPLLGDRPARQVGVAVGLLLILASAWLAVRWLGAQSVRQWRTVGALWVTLMTLGEGVSGRFAFGFRGRALHGTSIPSGADCWGLACWCSISLRVGWRARGDLRLPGARRDVLAAHGARH